MAPFIKRKESYLEEKFLTIDIETLTQMFESISKLAYLAGTGATSNEQLDDKGKTVVTVLSTVYTKTAEQYAEQFQVIDITNESLADELFKGILGDENN